MYMYLLVGMTAEPLKAVVPFSGCGVFASTEFLKFCEFPSTTFVGVAFLYRSSSWSPYLCSILLSKVCFVFMASYSSLSKLLTKLAQVLQILSTLDTTTTYFSLTKRPKT
jgi:hypothetical protein